MSAATKATARQQFERVLVALDQHHCEVDYKPGADKAKALCPVHGDRNPSLSIGLKDDKVMIRCFTGCTFAQIAEALELPQSAFFADGEKKKTRPRRNVVKTPYYAVDATGTTHGTHWREDFTYADDGTPGKKMWWEPEGVKTANMPLWNTPAAVMAAPDMPVWLCEGEKKAKRLQDELQEAGWADVVLATMTGASGLPCDDALRILLGRKVTFWPDNDADGKQHMRKIAQRLIELGADRAQLRLLDWPDAPAKGDAWDYFATGGRVDTLDQLDQMVKPFPAHQQEEEEQESAGESNDQAAAAPARQLRLVHPLVQINQVQLRQPVMATLGALREINRNRDVPLLFVRGGTLVRVLTDEHGEPVIDPLDADAMTWLATGSADFMKFDKDGTPVDAFPPPAVIKTLLGMGVWRDIPALRGTVAVPTLRPDGSILDRPGYDAATQLIYVPAPDFHMPPIAEEPSALEVAAAVDYINEELLADFPFVDAASKANAWALLLTPILRPAIAGCVPLALIDAPSPGSGKSLYCAVVALVATGQTAGILTAPQHDELEWRKRITAALRHGRPVVQIDNLADELKSAQLAAALTTEWWEDRELGYSRLLRLPQRATWMATGNNVKLGGDLPRRCYMVRLNTRLAKPWERKESEFRHPKLLRWVAEYRGELVAALLTIVRGWIQAGRPVPQDPPAMGSFEEWAELCAGVLDFAGVGGLLGNRTELYDRAAEEASQWQAFLEALRETWPEERPFNVTMVARALGEEQSRGVEEQRLLAALPEALAVALASKDAGLTLKLGKAFSQHADQRFGAFGIRVEQTGEKDHNKVLWRVVVGD